MHSRSPLLGVAICLAFGVAGAWSQCPNSGNTTTSATFCNSGTLTIENNANGPTAGSPYPFEITVSGMNGAVSGVSVTLNGYSASSGTPPADAVLMLVAPNGSALTFFGGVCGGGGSEPNNLDITLSDSGASFPPNGSYTSSCTSSTYKPYVNEADSTGSSGICVSSQFPSPANGSASCANNPSGSNTFTSVFTGASPNGIWKLYAYDISGSDIQTIQSGINLSITTEVTESATTTSVSSSAVQAFTSSPNNSLTFTASVTSGGIAVNEGVVQFYDNGTAIGSEQPVSTGQAEFTETFTTSSTEGTHKITAVYTDSGSNALYETSNNNAAPVSVFLDNHTVVSNGGTTFCNPGVASIASSGTTSPYPQHVFVAGLTGSLAGATLTFNNVTTSYGLVDWKALLVGPDGTSFVPMAFAGGYKAENGLTFSLSDSGAALLDSGTANTSPTQNGSYLPTAYQPSSPFVFPPPAPQSEYNYPATQGSATFATTFASENLNSTSQSGQQWSLYLSDSSGDTDSVAGGYCLSFAVNGGTATTTTVTANPNPAITNTQVSLSAHVTANGGTTNVSGGSVKFEQEGNPTPLGTASVDSNGNAAITFTPSTEGQYAITALYLGESGTYNLSQASTTLQVDNQTTVNGTSFCNPGPITITSSTNHTPQQYPSRVQVSNLAGVVSGVTLTLDNLTYSDPQDLAMLLASPNTSNNLVLWGNAGSTSYISDSSITIQDGASPLPQGANPGAQAYAPADYSGAYSLSFPAPAPASPNLAAPLGTGTLSSQFNGTNPNGYWDFYVMEPSAGGDIGSVGGHCVNLTITPPQFSLDMSHSGSFTQGDPADTYTITVNNSGPGNTAGTITLADTLPAGFSVVGMTETANSNGGTLMDWACTPSTATCTRTSLMPQGETDTITLQVSVGFSASTGSNAVSNTVQVSGGGAGNSPSYSDPTTVNPGLVQVSFETNPSGVAYSVDGTAYSAGTTLSFTDGSTHTITTTSPQGTNGTRNVWSNWSDGGAISHTITVSSTNGTASYLATFNTSYLLTTSATPTNSGSVSIVTSSPTGDGYYPSGSIVSLTASPNSGYTFTTWTGNIGGSTNPLQVTMNGPVSETGNFIANNVNVTVGTTPGNLAFTVDGANFTASQTFTWQVGSTHSIATASPQGTGGTRYAFAGWSDGGALSHQVTASTNTSSYLASFNASYLLTTAVTPLGAGTVSPNPASPTGDGFYPAGTPVTLTASPGSSYKFTGWTGTSSSATSPLVVTMTNPVSETATFALNNINVLIGTAPSGLLLSIDGGPPQIAPVSVTWAVASQHTLAAISPQGTNGTQYAFSSWSDGGAITHQVTASSSTTAYTASFTTQYILTSSVNPSGAGTVSPASGTYYTAGTVVSLKAAANSGYVFQQWTGPVSKSSAASTTVTMSAPQNLTANFTEGTTLLVGTIIGEQGPMSDRQWKIGIVNSGPGAANSAQIASLGVSEVQGPKCAPTVLTTMPISLGNLAPGGTGTATVAINFNGCAANTRFSVKAPLTANGGKAGGLLIVPVQGP